jgi:hypothetical protein
MTTRSGINADGAVVPHHHHQQPPLSSHAEDGRATIDKLAAQEAGDPLLNRASSERKLAVTAEVTPDFADNAEQVLKTATRTDSCR